MKKVDRFFIFVFSLFSWVLLPAQTTDHVLGELLVQLRTHEDARRWIKNWDHFAGRPTNIRILDCPSAPLNIWRLHFDYGNTHELRLLSSIRKDQAVVAAQFNHFVDLRSTVPDDPKFEEQWQYINLGQNGGVENADLDMDLAWDITTGGLTADSDTIVVCVIDDGVNIEHEDLAGNLWFNRAEIPGNEIDDDLNGYVDDYQGWNVLQDNDNIGTGGSHGTSVKGIIGAIGNNGIGVSGINWQVKIMVIKNNFNTTEATVIEAYSYPLIQRKRYNETNGQEGAFVVATNASWGLDNGMAEDAPIWCGLYDSLGVHGIISCGATTNEDINVDEDGDLPTTCPSDFLLSVTNLDSKDEKVKNAGYGAVNIDLGAYGQEAYTLTRSNYGPFRGTSSATPHVTGAVALLFSAPCPTLMAIAKSDPQAAALLVRQYIMDGVTPNASLEGITVSDGRLNIFNSLQLLMDNCRDCQPPTSINPQNISDTSAEIKWVVNDSISRVDLRFRLAGTTAWTEVTNAQSPYPLNNLLACTDYEFQLRTFCDDEDLGYTGSRFFKTDGCCEAPEPIQVSALTEVSALLTWPSVLAADRYILRWREKGTSDWQEIITVQELVFLSGLSGCTFYEYQLALDCSDDRTAEGSIFSFNTLGCGVCQESDYCNPGAYDATGEWIAQVSLGTLNNQTESDNGYGDYTGLEVTLLEQGKSYPIVLRPDYSDQAFGEYFLVWIDLNQDGVFLEEELLYDPGMTTKDTLIGQIDIPIDAKLGNTRMRVAMRFQSPVSPCSEFGGNVFGEVEDYCVELVAPSGCELPSAFDTVTISLNEATLRWAPAPEVSNYNVRYRNLSDVLWNTLAVSDTMVTINGLDQCNAYEAQVQSDCGETQSIFLGNLLFDTKCLDIINEPQTLNTWQAYPNPFRNRLYVSWEVIRTPSTPLQVQLLHPSGQIIKTKQVPSLIGLQITEFSTDDLPSGLYLLKILDQKQVLGASKIIKMQ